MNQPSWIPFAFLSAVFAGVVAILGKIGVKSVDSNLATAIRTVVILVFAWGIVLAQGKVRDIHAIPIRTLLFLVLSGIATGLSWLFYFRALQLGEASKVAPVDKLSIVFTLFFAALFLGEKLTLGTLVGGGLITAGTFVLLFLK